MREDANRTLEHSLGIYRYEDFRLPVGRRDALYHTVLEESHLDPEYLTMLALSALSLRSPSARWKPLCHAVRSPAIVGTCAPFVSLPPAIRRRRRPEPARPIQRHRSRQSRCRLPNHPSPCGVRSR
jgi:hypothetical protein